MPVNITGLLRQVRPHNSAYILKKAADAAVNTEGAKLWEKGLIKANALKGETFNNIVTAVGTAGVAPFFIIHSPSKEDKNTKKYTAWRQPISAGITLCGQVPVMAFYNKIINDYVTKHHLDRCDLSAAPNKDFLKNIIKGETEKFLFQNPEALDVMSKSEIKELIFQREKNNAFYDQLRTLRAAVHRIKDKKTGKIPEIPQYLKNCMDESGNIMIEKMLSPADYDYAEKLIAQQQLKDTYNVVFNEKGNIIQIGDKVVAEADQKGVKNLYDVQKGAIRKLMKKYGIDVKSEAYKNMTREVTEENIRELASENVKDWNFSNAKIKFKQAQLATDAKAQIEAYDAQLTAQGKSIAEKIELLKAKNKELFLEMERKAKALLETAPETVEYGSREMTKDEVKVLIEKIHNKIENKYDIDSLGEIEQKVKAVKNKIYNCFANDKNVSYMKTEGRKTFEETLKDVQVKKWLTARINNSEKIFVNFKTMSGLIVGLGILPFTCGLLNWAYPRIMEEFFPKLANAKAESAKAKEAK